MKLLFVLMMGLLPFSNSFSQSTKQIVEISNLEDVKGTLYVGWYSDPSDFRINEKAIYREEVDVNNQSKVSVQFSDIPAGNYAIAVFLDENDNYKLDRNWLGLPKEKYGFSNNKLHRLRPASFKESVFSLNEEEKTVSIKLK